MTPRHQHIVTNCLIKPLFLSRCRCRAIVIFWQRKKITTGFVARSTLVFRTRDGHYTDIGVYLVIDDAAVLCLP